MQGRSRPSNGPITPSPSAREPFNKPAEARPPAATAAATRAAPPTTANKPTGVTPTAATSTAGIASVNAQTNDKPSSPALRERGRVTPAEKKKEEAVANGPTKPDKAAGKEKDDKGKAAKVEKADKPLDEKKVVEKAEDGKASPRESGQGPNAAEESFALYQGHSGQHDRGRAQGSVPR